MWAGGLATPRGSIGLIWGGQLWGLFWGAGRRGREGMGGRDKRLVGGAPAWAGWGGPASHCGQIVGGECFRGLLGIPEPPCPSPAFSPHSCWRRWKWRWRGKPRICQWRSGISWQLRGTGVSGMGTPQQGHPPPPVLLAMMRTAPPSSEPPPKVVGGAEGSSWHGGPPSPRTPEVGGGRIPCTDPPHLSWIPLDWEPGVPLPAKGDQGPEGCLVQILCPPPTGQKWGAQEAASPGTSQHGGPQKGGLGT